MDDRDVKTRSEYLSSCSSCGTKEGVAEIKGDKRDG